MHFAKFQKTNAILTIVIGMILSGNSYALVDSATAAGGKTAQTSTGTNFQFGENPFPEVPNYGGTFTPGIGAATPGVGIPGVDAVKLGELVYKTITEQLQGEMIKEIENTFLDMIGQNGKDQVEAINNDVANAIARMGGAKGDIHNREVLEQIQSSKSVCKDLAFSMSMGTDKACETMNDIYDMYNTTPGTNESSALMTIAKGLNSSFSDVEHLHNKNIKRIIQRHESGLKASTPVQYYSADRFISQSVATFDTDQAKDLKDFMYIIMPPVYDSKETDRSIEGNNTGSKATDQAHNRSRIDRGLTGSIFASSLVEKLPSETGLSPFATMREYAKTTYSVENIEKLSKGEDMTPTQLYRQMALMKAFKSHQMLKSYEHALQQEQLAARKLIEAIDPIRK